MKRPDWESVMTVEEKGEFEALELSLDHIKVALKALSIRRGLLRNRLVMRLNWRKKNVPEANV